MIYIDAIKGNYYRYIYSDTGYDLIGICTISGTSNANAFRKNSHEYWDNGNFCSNIRICEDVTEEEKAHLDACIKAGKYVPAPEYTQNYQIFN